MTATHSPRAFMQNGHVTDEALSDVYTRPNDTHDVNPCQFSDEVVAEIRQHVDGCDVCQHALEIKLAASSATADLSYRDVKDSPVLRPQDLRGLWP